MTGVINEFGFVGVIDSVGRQRDEALAEIVGLKARIAELENILQELWEDNPAIPLSDYYVEKIRKAIGK